MEKRNAGIDLLKLVFACLIPLLHIPFAEKGVVAFFEQYVARMGVPFFFAASGYFLQQSIEKRDSYEALKRFCCRIGKLLGIWLLIDMPLIVALTDKYDMTFFQELLFRTPAYLWYLTAMLVASVPFCLVKTDSYVLCIGLYVIGALLGDTYSWLLGGWPAYEKVFLTTRNGIFFAYPLMYVGKIVYNNKSKVAPNEKVILIISMLLLCIEVSIVRGHTLPSADTSMYLLLPLVTYLLLRILSQTNVKWSIPQVGTAIYMMQYWIIIVCRKIFSMTDVASELSAWITYMLVLLIPCIVHRMISKTRIKRMLF